MSTNTSHYPPTDVHYQLSPQRMNWRIYFAALAFIANLLFWLIYEVKYAGFKTLPYAILHLSNQYESIVRLPLCIATWILLFVIGIAILDPTRSKKFRIRLLIGSLIFIFINLFGCVLYAFGGSKQFSVIESVSSAKATYHLALMDTDSCNNPPCYVNYWYRLYQCDLTDTACQIISESEQFWRWLGEPNKSAQLQSNEVNNKLEIIVDDKVIFSGIVSP